MNPSSSVPLATANRISQQTLTIVDTGIPGWQAVAADASVRGDVLVLNPDEDGVLAITDHLKAHRGYDVVGIFSEGSEAALYLGNARLDSRTLSQYATSIQSWGDFLNRSGDILLFGCNVGTGLEGPAFVQRLATITGADVAASDDPTGPSRLGGDSELEVHSGSIEANVAQFSGSLAGLPRVLDVYTDDPTVNTPGAQITNEDTPFVFGSTVVVSAPNSNRMEAVVEVTAGNGLISDGEVAETRLASQGDRAGITAFLNSLNFVATANWNGTATIQVTITSDYNNRVVTNTETRSFQVTVNALNDAPVASGASPTLTAVNEDALSASVTGNTITALYSSNFSDSGDTVAGGSSANTFAGIAIVGNTLNAAQGAWEYSTDGTSWNAIGARSSSTTLLLLPADRLRFMPAANWFGTPAALTVRLIDSAGGAVTRGNGPNLSAGGSTGGATVYSGATVGLSTSVLPINDTPATSDFSFSVTKNSSTTLTLTSTDADTGTNSTTDAAVNGYRIVAISANGTLRDSDGVVMTAGANITIAKATNMTFTPTTNFTGATTFTFRAVDAFGALSTTSTANITVDSFNEPPVLTVPGVQTVAEDANVSISGISMADADAASATVQMALSVSHGTVTIGSLTGLTVQSGANGSAAVTVRGTMATLNTRLANLLYTPTAQYFGPDTLVVTADDLGASGSPTKQDTENITINVTAVADKPVGGASTLAAVNEDAVNPSGALVSALMTTYSDLDGQALGGVAISADGSSASTQGSWQYSVSNGATWNAVGSVSSASALLLPTSAKLRFVPVANYFGTPGTLTLYVLDNSGARTFTTNPASRQTINVTVSANDLAVAGGALSTSVNPVNDVMTVITSLPLAVNEGGTGLLGSTMLNITDTEATASQIVYTVVAGGTNLTEGTMQLDSAANGTFSTTVTTGTQFTQAQINANRLRYVHNGNEHSTPQSLAYSVTDNVAPTGGTVLTRSLSIEVSPVNDVPLLYVPGQTPPSAGLLVANVAKAGTLTFSIANIFVVDPDNTNEQLVFRLESLPAFGELRYNGGPVGVGSVFNYANLGLLQFIHDGGDETADVFNITLRDGAGGIVSSRAVNLVIGRFNSAPIIDGRATILERDTDVTLALNIADGQTATDNLTIRILSLPTATEATLKFNGVAITPAQVSSGFNIPGSQRHLLTISHISANRVNPPDVTFNVRVTDDGYDGGGFVAPLNSTATINVEVRPVDDEPTVLLGSLDIPTRGATGTFTDDQLAASDVDTPASVLLYRVDARPVNGTLRLSGVPLGVGATFTQDDVDSGRLTYRHRGTATTTDSFDVTLRDQGYNIRYDRFGGVYPDTVSSTLSMLTVNITIAPSGPITGGGGGGQSGSPGSVPIVAFDDEVETNKNVPAIVNQSVLLANDGGTTPFTIVSVNNAVNGTVGLAAGVVTFTPTHNFSGTGSFDYTMQDNEGRQDVAHVDVVVYFVNYAPVITTLNALALNEGATAPLTDSLLEATDVDNADSELVFVISSLPTNGTLYYDSTPGDDVSNAIELLLLDTFTQAQVTAGTIKFEHDGSEDFISSVGLALSDGACDPILAVLNIGAFPVNDAPVLVTNDFNQDEDATTVIDNSILSVSDLDGIDDDVGLSPDTLTYSIANAGHLPTHGVLRLDNDGNGSFETTLVASSTFTPAQVTAGRLQYDNDGSENITDAFTVTINDGAGAPNSVVTDTVNIGIIPVNDDPVIVNNTGMTVNEGATATIGTGRLSGSDPDNTNTQIQFRITTNTAHGSLYLTQGVTTTLLGVGSAITQQEIMGNNLFYVHDGLESTSDAFHFRLSDGGGGNEPSGIFPITITPVNDAPVVVLPADQTAVEGVALLINTIVIEDPDSVNLSEVINPNFGPIQVTVTAGNGTLDVTASGGTVVGGDNTDTITLTGLLGEVNATLATLRYTSDGDFSGPDTITVVANDQGNSGSGTPLSDTEVLDVDVLSVNDGPVIARPATQNVNEDTNLVFSSGNGNSISFSDVDIAAGNASVTLVVTNGTLTLGGTAGLSGLSGNGSGTISFSGSQSAVNTALQGLIYRATTDYHGAVTLTITVNDQGNTGDISIPMSDVKSVAITVDPVNDTPVTVAQNTTINEDATATLTLQSTDVDSNQGGSNTTNDAIVNRYRIVAIAANGTLRDSSSSVMANGSLITAAAATNMTFVPTGDYNGVATFTFRAVDAAGGESTTSTFTVNITAVNDTPVLAGAGDAVSFTEGSGAGQAGTAVRLDGNSNFALASDVELTVRSEDNFSGSSITSVRSTGQTSTDRMSLDTAFAGDGATVSVAGANLSYNGTLVGTVSDNGSNGRYTVVFNASATQAAVTAVMKRLTYNSTDDDLSGSITVNVTFDDGNGAVSAGAQGTGGARSATGAFTVNITNVNDSPQFTGNGTAPVAEDTASPAGATINTLMAANFFDIDASILGAGEFAGIAITADASNQTTQGRWQYSANAGATWSDVTPLGAPAEAPSATQALLLNKASLLRFIPVADFNDRINQTTTPAGALTVVAVDSSGARTYTSNVLKQFVNTVAGWTDVSDLGSASPVSIVASVSQVNDAPVISNLHNDTTGFIEAVGVNIAGTASLLDNPIGPGGMAAFSDIDLTVRNETTFNGATLSVQQKSGVDTFDFFVPQTGGGITLSGAYTEPGPGLKLFNNGSLVRYNGVTFATITDNSDISGRLLLTFNQNTTKAAMDALFQNLVYSNNNPTITASSKTVTLTFTDGNGNTNNSQGSGGALSTAADVVITITPTNDSPAFTSGATILTAEDVSSTAATVSDLLLAKFIDLDELPSDLAGIAIGGYTDAGLGTWQVNFGSGWFSLNTLSTNSGGVSPANALMLSVNTQIQFVPAANANTAGGVVRPTLAVYAVEDVIPTGAPSGHLTTPAFTTNAAAPATFNTTTDDLDSLVSNNTVPVEVQISARNDASTFATGTPFTGTLLESPVLGTGTSLQQLLSSVSVADLDLASTATLAATNFGAGSITVAITGGVTGDMFTIAGSPAGIASSSGGSNGASLVVNLLPTTTLSQLNTILEAIRYQHTTDEPPSGTRAFTVTLSDGNNTDAQSDTAGGPTALSVPIAGSITLTAANDPPQLTATPRNPTHTEGSAASAFYTSANTNVTGSGQNIIEIQFTLANLSNGSDEKITIDGAELSIADGAMITSTGSVSITLVGSTATIVYTNSSGLTAAQANSFINALAYRNSSDAPTGGTRTLTITSLQDDGGIADSGDDTNTTLGVTASVVTVVPLNDAPTIVGVMANPTAAEAAGAGTGVDPVILLNSGGLSDVDGAPANMGLGSITVSFTSYVTGDILDFATGVAHSVNAVQLSGSNVQISNGSAWTTIGTVNGTDNGQARNLVINLNSSATEDHIGAVLSAVRYRSTSDNPTTNNTATTRTYSFVVNDGNNNNTAGGPTSLNSNILSGGTLTITPLNDIPVVDLNGVAAGVTNAVAWNEVANGTHVAAAISSAGTYTDPDNTNFTQMVMTVTGVLDGNSERLIIGGSTFPLATAAVSTDIGAFRVSYNNATGVFTITPDGPAVALLTDYQTLLRGITYNNTTDNPTAGDRAIAINVTDAGLNNNSDANNLTSINATTTITVAPTNDQPVISALDAATFYEHAINAAAATIDSDITLTDIDSSNYSGGTLTISGLVAGQDIVSLSTTSPAASGSVRANGTNVEYHNGTSWSTVGTFSGGSGANFIVSLNATATVSITERIIESLQFANTSLAPTTSRTLTVATNDNDGNAVQNATVLITIRLDNDAPVLSSTALGTTYIEQAAAAAFIGGTISVTDPDANANFYNGGANIGSLTVALDGYVAGDTLSVNHVGTGAGQIGVSGSTISYAGANFATTAGGSASNLVITFTSNSATPTAVQALLAQLRFRNSASDDPTVNTTDTSRVFTVTLNDGANTRDASSATTALTGALVGTITITPVNDLPVLTPTAGAVTYVERASALTVDNAITVTDVDDTQIVSASVSITSGFTTLDTLAATAAGGILVSYDPGTGVLSLSGTTTLANYQTVLRSLTFSSTSEDPTVDASRLTRTLSYAVVDANSDAAGAATGTSTKVINITAINSKTVVTAGAILAYTEQDPAAVIDNTITLADVDDTQIASARVTISTGRTAGDILAVASQNGITGSYNSGTGVLTLTGTTTLANYRTALRSVTFNSTSDHPTAISTSRLITWDVTDANSDQVGAQTSLAGVTSTINITPVNDAPVNTLAATSSVLENHSLAFTGPITLSVDDVDLNLARSQVTVTDGTLTLSIAGGATVSAGANGSSTITVTGTQTQVNAALATLVYQPTTNFNGTATLTLVSTDSGTPALVDTDIMAITVDPINSEPAGTDATFLVIQNSTYPLTAASFGFTDPNDTPADELSRVRITTLPTDGILTNNGTPVIAGGYVTLANIDGGLLVFTPTPDEGGTAYASFTFQVEDDGGTANGGINLDASPNTIVFNVSGTDPQHICFCPPAKASRYATVDLTATASSGLTVTFSVASGPGAITGNILSFTGAGPVVVQARQNGDATYAAAPIKTETVQSIDFYMASDVADGWTTTYGGEDDALVNRNTDGKAIAMQVVGNYAVALAATGSTTNTAGNRDIFTAKYDTASGEKLWSVLHGGEAKLDDEGGAVAMDSLGNVYITGTVTNSAKNTDIYVAKYASATGALLWEQTFKGINGTTDTGNDGPGGYQPVAPYQGGDLRRGALTLTPDGGVVITGYVTKADKKLDAVTIKYDALGNRAWFGVFNGTLGGHDYGQSVAVDAAGDVFVSGASFNANLDALTMKYSGANGTRLWAKTYDGGKPDSAVAIKIGSDGHPVISGYSQRSTFDFMTARYDSTDGTLIWMNLLDGPANSSDMAWDFALLDGTRPIVVGTSYPANGIYDGYIFTYNCPCSADPIAWAKRYEGPANRLDQFLTLGTDMFGNAVATGYSQNADGTVDTQTVKYAAADGSILWSKRYNGSANGNDVPRQILVDPAGNVFISGFTTNDNGSTSSWVTRYVATEPATSAAQVINFLQPPTQGVADTLTLAATASSGLPVSYTVVSGPATLTGNALTFTGMGSVTVRATQAGDGTHNAATPVVRTFTVGKSRQVIVFSLPKTTTATTTVSLEAETNSSLPITYTIVSGPATLSGSSLTFTAAGSVTVRASQAGDSRYLAAQSVEQTITVEESVQTITFTLPLNALATDAITLGATSNSNLPVTYTVVSGPGSVSGGVLTFTGQGSVVVRASQTGSALFDPATSVSRTISVKKAPQTIAYITPEVTPMVAEITDSINVSAVASSGLPITYSVTGPATLSASKVLTFKGAGRVTLLANQAGNALYSAAPVAQQIITVIVVKPTLDPITLEDAFVGQLIEQAITSTGNATRITATGLPAGVTLNATTGLLTGRPTTARMVSGEPAPYTVTFTASNAAGDSDPVTVLWTISPLASDVVGTFNGLMDPTNDLSLTSTQHFSGLGGRFTLTTTTVGSYSGKLMIDTVNYTFTGKLEVPASGSNPSGTAIIKRANSPSLTVTFSIDSETSQIWGSVGDGIIMEYPEIMAWRNPWSTTANPATAMAGTYTGALEPEQEVQGAAAFPQGNGFTTLKVTAAGVASWSGKLADGTVTTASSAVGPHGEIPLHIPLYTPTVAATAGATNGWVQVDAGQLHLLGGGLRWKKNPQAPNSTSRSYKQGFPAHRVGVIGGKYDGTPIVVPPSEGNNTANNAILTFAEGGIEHSAFTQATGGVLRQAFRLKDGRTVTMPISPVSNPAAVKLTLSPTTGLISGTFTLKDADPTDTVPPIAVITRTVTYTGVMVPLLNQGVGHFILPQLPSISPNTTTNVNTSAQMSGQVLLKVIDLQ